MTVAELIQKLSHAEDDATVLIDGRDWEYELTEIEEDLARKVVLLG